MSKLVSKIILEGTRLTFKTEIALYNDLQVFIVEQELMNELVGASTLQTLTIDISDNDVPRAVENIADWIEQTGELYMSKEQPN